MTLANQDQQPASTVLMTLIERATTDEAFNLDKLSQLLDVKERWDREEARKAFVTALSEFKRNPPRLVKSQTVDFTSGKGRTHYKYASLGEVAADIATGLSPHGLSHSWAVSQERGQVSVTCTLTHKGGHSESVTITGPQDDTGNKNGIQQIGSAIAYLERYTLMAITGLAAVDQDDDGQARQGAAARPQPPAPVQQYDSWEQWARSLEATTATEWNGILDSLSEDAPANQKNWLVHVATERGWGFDKSQLRFLDPAVNQETGEIVEGGADLCRECRDAPALENSAYCGACESLLLGDQQPAMMPVSEQH